LMSEKKIAKRLRTPKGRKEKKRGGPASLR